MARIALVTLCITALGSAMGCGGETIIDNSTTVRSPIKGGKADQASGSCAGQCGGQAADGPCWCDDLCSQFGDCCYDRVPVCTPERCSGLDGETCRDTTGCRSSIVPIPCDCMPGEDPGCVCPLGGALQCVPCPLVSCELECPRGLQTDSNGCGMCACNEPPSCELRPTDTCEDDPTCELRIVPIPCDCLPGEDGCMCPLGGALTCGPKCQPVLCELYCAGGFVTDENGCGVCKCAEPPDQCAALTIEECHDDSACDVGILPIPCDCAPEDEDCICPLGGQQFCYAK